MSKSYYCTKCNRKHYRGKIHEKHKKFRQIEVKKQQIYKVKNFKEAWKTLSVVAKRQLIQLIYKLNLSYKYNLYRREISKLLERELDKKYLVKTELIL